MSYRGDTFPPTAPCQRSGGPGCTAAVNSKALLYPWYRTIIPRVAPFACMTLVQVMYPLKGTSLKALYCTLVIPLPARQRLSKIDRDPRYSAQHRTALLLLQKTVFALQVTVPINLITGFPPRILLHASGQLYRKSKSKFRFPTHFDYCTCTVLHMLHILLFAVLLLRKQEEDSSLCSPKLNTTPRIQYRVTSFSDDDNSSAFSKRMTLCQVARAATLR